MTCFVFFEPTVINTIFQRFWPFSGDDTWLGLIANICGSFFQHSAKFLVRIFRQDKKEISLLSERNDCRQWYVEDSRGPVARIMHEHLSTTSLVLLLDDEKK